MMCVITPVSQLLLVAHDVVCTYVAAQVPEWQL